MPRRHKTPADMRRAELAKIHLAKKALGLDDDTYRDVLWTICRVRSAADLDSQGRFKLLAHFRSLGWHPTRKKEPKSGRMTGEQMGKIEALLADAGLPWQYAHSMAAHMFRKERLEWITIGEARKLIAALEYAAGKRRARQHVMQWLSEHGRDKSWIEAQLKLPPNWWNKTPVLHRIIEWLESQDG